MSGEHGHDDLSKAIKDLRFRVDRLGEDFYDTLPTIQDNATEIENLWEKINGEDPIPEPPPPPPPPSEENPFAGMLPGTVEAYGPSIKDIWQGINLNNLTNGVGGPSSTLNAWGGKTHNVHTKKAYFGGGGHADGGWNVIHELDVLTGKGRFYTNPNFQLSFPEGYEGRCPYPEAIYDEKGGPPAGHYYDMFDVTPDGKIYLWSQVSYDCMGPGNEAPNRIWAADPKEKDLPWPAGWRIARTRTGASGCGVAPLPDGSGFLVIGKRRAGIFCTEDDEYIPFRMYGGLQSNDGELFKKPFSSSDGYGSLVRAGTDENGAYRYIYYDYSRNIFEISLTKDGPYWSVKSTQENIVKEGRSHISYTNAATFVPSSVCGEDCVVFWSGRNKFVYLVLGNQPHIRTYRDDSIRKLNPRSKIQPMKGCMEFYEDLGVILAIGPHHTDGMFAIAPVEDVLRHTEVAGPDPIDLENILDRAQPGDVVNLKNEIYRPARVSLPDLTVIGTTGTSINGITNGQGSLVVNEDNFEIENLQIIGRSNSAMNAACIWMARAGLKGKNLVLRNSDNGIITSHNYPGNVDLDDCLFMSLGNNGKSHGIYVTIKENNKLKPDITLNLTRCKFVEPKGSGHQIKTGARVTIIEDCEIIGGSSIYSRSIDAYSAPEVFKVLGTKIKHTAASENEDCIGFGGEWKRRYEGPYQVIFEDCTIEGPGYGTFFRTWVDAMPVNEDGVPLTQAIDNGNKTWTWGSNLISGFNKLIDGKGVD